MFFVKLSGLFFKFVTVLIYLINNLLQFSHYDRLIMQKLLSVLNQNSDVFRIKSFIMTCSIKFLTVQNYHIICDRKDGASFFVT